MTPSGFLASSPLPSLHSPRRGLKSKRRRRGLGKVSKGLKKAAETPGRAAKGVAWTGEIVGLKGMS